MNPINPTLKVTQQFFDRKAVRDAVGKEAAAGLSKFGSYVRQRARSSMRPGGKKGKTAAKGQPPRTHRGDLKRLLFFSWDPETRSVVVGPTPFAKGIAPNVLEFGGTVPGGGRTIRVRRDLGRDAAGRFASGGFDKVVLNGAVHYSGNPYMRPALEAEIPNMPKAWSTAVKGS